MTAIIGMDPHKRSATIEVIDERGQTLAVGRFSTDKAGYAEMLQTCRRFSDRVWAVEDDSASSGCLYDAKVRRQRPVIKSWAAQPRGPGDGKPARTRNAAHRHSGHSSEDRTVARF
jgi:hypothetical protein